MLCWKQLVKCTWVAKIENLTLPYSQIFHHRFKRYTSSKVGEMGEKNITNLPKQPIHLNNLKRGSTSMLSHQDTKSPSFLLKTYRIFLEQQLFSFRATFLDFESLKTNNHKILKHYHYLFRVPNILQNKTMQILA